MITGTRADLRRLAELDMLSKGGPRKARPVTPGRHYPIADDPSEDPVGWTLRETDPVPIENGYALDLDADVSRVPLASRAEAVQLIAKCQVVAGKPVPRQPSELAAGEIAERPRRIP